MQVVSKDEVDRLLTWPALIDALGQAFAAGWSSPARMHYPVGPDNGHGHGGPMHLLMPCWTPDAPAEGSFLGVKIVNVYPDNGRKGLPAVLGTYLLHSGATGEPLAAIDGTRLTHWRTAAASALAARFLSRPDSRHLVMVGTGALAPFLVRAHAAVRPLDRITIWGRNRAAAEQVVAALADPRWQVAAADDLEAAVEGADIVSCATLATQPLVEGAWLRPGTHLDLVGAFTPSMREVDDEAVQNARVFIDTPVALTEGGDVEAAIRSGAVTADHVAGTLFDLCRGDVQGRRSASDVTLFKSVGTALEDLAAAVMVWQGLQA